MSLARELKGDLDRIAARADTGSSQGLHRLLQGEGVAGLSCGSGFRPDPHLGLCSRARWCLELCFVLDGMVRTWDCGNWCFYGFRG